MARDPECTGYAPWTEIGNFRPVSRSASLEVSKKTAICPSDVAAARGAYGGRSGSRQPPVRRSFNRALTPLPYGCRQRARVEQRSNVAQADSIERTEASAPSTPPAASLRTGFADQVKGAVIWRSGSQFAGQLIAWTSTFLVLRLLEPSDYGLVAMTAVVLSFLDLFNGWGFASALVRDERIDSRQIGQAFQSVIVL